MKLPDRLDVQKCINQVLWSLVTKIHGPFLARLSQRWISFIDLAGSRIKIIHTLQYKYGRVVRTEPDEVSFIYMGPINEILVLTSPFMKAPIYDSMSVKLPGIFSLGDKKQH